jgi:hypothetical protein
MRRFHCDHCGEPVEFTAYRCLGCDAPLEMTRCVNCS